MGITKVLKIGSADTTNGKYLLNSIKYIMNPEKTEGGLYVGGNSGTEAYEAYHTMLDTKREWNKLDKRQGYHFVISFPPEEATADQMYRVLQDFCEEYLGDNYDYVFAVHTDQAHMHGHIVFNSVSRTSGYKYRYEKGDWEKYIQPVTDRVCEKYGLPKLEYDKNNKKGRSYAEHFAEKQGRPSYKKIVQADIDYVIRQSDSYEEFLEQMKILGYHIKSGKYVYFTAPGYKRSKRDYKLGPGYTIADIKDRIAHKLIQEDVQLISPKLLKSYNTSIRKLVSPSMSDYQKNKVQLFYQAGRYLEKRNPYAVTERNVRRNAVNIDRIYQECVYILRNNIQSEDDLLSKRLQLEKREEQLKNIRNAKYLMKNDGIVKNYEALQQRLKEIPAWEDTYEEVQAQMEQLEQVLPSGYHKLYDELREAQAELEILRDEKRIVNRLIKNGDRSKVIQEFPEGKINTKNTKPKI